jgi:hypothetical protein
MAHETVRVSTQGQLKDIAATLIGAIPELSFNEAKAVIGDKGTLVASVHAVFAKWKILSILQPIASGIQIPAVMGVMVRDCFQIGGGVFAYRDTDFDKWLPNEVSAVGPGNASIFELMKESSFKEMTEAHLGITGSIDELSDLLVKNQKTWSPKQVESIIRDCERGENHLKLNTNGYANFFFTEAGGNIFAVDAYRNSNGWDVYVLRFGDADRWNAGYRVLFRNC